MRAHDTTADAEEVQLRMLREAGGERRLRMACSLSAGVRQLSKAGIQLRHPAYAEGDIEVALGRLVLGDELFRMVWPNAPLRSP